MEKSKILSKELPIGFFDSGVGGLSVFSRFRSLLPSENLIYFGDLKNLPYGSKTQDELIGFARNILNFYKTKNVKAVVIACNTSSALAYETIKDEYDFKIYPIIQSCAEVIANMNLRRIGVFATVGTVKSGAYEREISKFDKYVQVKEIACPNWVNIVESNSLDTDYALNDVKACMSEMLEYNPDKIILGCTHYPYLMSLLKGFADESIFLDPAKIFVEYLKNDIQLNQSSTVGTEQFYVSANPQGFIKNAKLFYDIKELPEVILF